MESETCDSFYIILQIPSFPACIIPKKSLHQNVTQSGASVSVACHACQRSTLRKATPHVASLIPPCCLNPPLSSFFQLFFVPFDRMPCYPCTFLTSFLKTPLANLLIITAHSILAHFSRFRLQSATASKKRRQSASP